MASSAENSVEEMGTSGLHQMKTGTSKKKTILIDFPWTFMSAAFNSSHN